MWWDSLSVAQQVMFIVACATTFILIMQIILMLISGATDADVGGGGISDADASDFGGGGISDVSDVSDVGGGGLSSVFDGSTGGLSEATLGGSGDFDGGSGGSDGTDGSHGATMPFGLRLLSLRSIIAFVAVGAWVGYTLMYVLDWYFAVIIACACGFAAACGMAAALVGMEKLQGNGNLNPMNAIGKIGTVYLTVPPSRSGKGKINILIQERYAEYEAMTDSEESIPTSSEIKVVGCVEGNVLLVSKYKQPSIIVENTK
ncbi:MAG: hypothetical protein NC184_07425 [Roseburia sp.]|nr:hypothetical protein [Roseburia sp.]